MGTAVVDYDTLARRVEEALRAQFPTDTIDLEEGYLGRVHIRIVSKQFNGKRERDKQAIVWAILKEALGEDAQFVSLVLPYGTDELP
jgi:stress-induced morphogen